MSAQPLHGHGEDDATIPMPPLTEAALRVAVTSIDLAAAVRFEQEFHTAWQEAVQSDSTVPMHTFLRRWGIFVALRRHPSRAARLRELERAVARAATPAEAREGSAEIGRLVDAATRELTA